MERRQILDSMVANILWTHSFVSCVMKLYSMTSAICKHSNFATFKGHIKYFYITILSNILIMRHKHLLKFVCVSSQPFSLSSYCRFWAFHYDSCFCQITSSVKTKVDVSNSTPVSSHFLDLPNGIYQSKDKKAIMINHLVSDNSKEEMHLTMFTAMNLNMFSLFRFPFT